MATVRGMIPSAWALGWRNLWRDWRGGELRLLMAAVTLAVTALTAVGFFSDRLQGGLRRDARQLLGGDVVLVSDHAPDAVWSDQARALGLQTALAQTFPTMARASDGQGGASALVALKAVSAGYPLRGQLLLARDAGDRAGEPAEGIPPPGQAWVDPALLDALEIHGGDALLLGDARLRVARLIALEPDRGVGLIGFSPRVMVNAADLPATGLVQPASRVTWRLALAGPDEAVRRYREWAEAELARPGARGMRLETLDNARPEMRAALERGGKFLNLVALLAALLSAVALALAARGFAARHLDSCAMLRVLGLPQRRIALAYVAEFLLAGLLASLAGSLLGYAAHHGFVWLLAGLVQADLPAPGAWPLVFGLGIGLTLLAAFGLPPVLQLARVPPLRVIRRELGLPKTAPLAALALGVAGFAALLLAVSADLTLGLIAVGGFAGAALLFALLAWGAARLLRRWAGRLAGPRWLLLAARQLTARPAYVAAQVSGLAVGLLALALLALLRGDLVASWRAATPADAPNRFVINITPEQGADFRAALAQAGVRQPDWYPMFRGRLVAVNGREVSPASYPDERARRLVEREFNLSHDEKAPAWNAIAAGRWTAGEAGAISVEQGLADTLGLQLGDTLRFAVAGAAPLQARITSLRKVDWSSMHVNFFVIFPLADMPPGLPITWIAAYRAPRQPGFDNALVRRFPNITNIDMEQTIAQVQRVLDQVIGAVQFLFVFTLAAGLAVLFAAIGATREERAREMAILRALGAGSRLLTGVQCAELAAVGLLAGLLAGAVAMLIGWAMARWAFDFTWTAWPPTPLATAAAGALLALLAGWPSLREVLRRPVMQTLRRVGG